MQSLTEPRTPSNATRCVQRLALLLSAAACLTGCGNTLYAFSANSAASKLEEARNAGAEQRAPYEYTLAKEHLEKAMSEAAEADYGDAYELANAAYEYAEQAVQHCTQKTQANVNAVSVKETAQ